LEEEDNFFSPEFYKAFPHLKHKQFPTLSRFDSNGDDFFKFTTHLDRFDNKWRDDPFWRDLYPRWAEPIFKVCAEKAQLSMDGDLIMSFIRMVLT
jgi:hypothetical protein